MIGVRPLAGLLALLLLAFGSAAAAQTVRIQTGEHADFTRLVLILPNPAEWRLGRTEEGYEVRLAGAPARFDLTRAFQTIPRTRLRSIWADPASGALTLGVGCACHAVPFEERPGILVIDLRDGAPEAGSPYELTLDGRRLAPLRGAPGIRPRLRPPAAVAPRLAATPGSGELVPPGLFAATPPPTLWALSPEPAMAPTPPPFRPRRAPAGSAGTPAIAEMRAVLLEELGRAASAGIIEMDDPVFPPAPPGETRDPPPEGLAAHMDLRAPGLVARSAGQAGEPLTAEGDVCLGDEVFALADWTDGRPFPKQLASARTGLVGEFDRPDPERIAALVRLYLYHGFGAETLNLLDALPAGLADAEVLRAMAHVMDAQPVPAGNPLLQQAACPGRVALWSALARPKIMPGDGTETGAILIAFSDLPVHLRRHLGPGLAEKFLSSGDAGTAQRLRDAIWRAPGDPGAEALLMDGQLARARGDLGAAETAFAAASRGGGPPAVRALVELVDARIALGEPIDIDTMTEAAALRREMRGSALEAPLFRAEMLARASGGDYATAFGMAAETGPQNAADLWRLLAASGPDSALLDHAVLAPGMALPPIDSVTRERIGARLLSLGFPDEALLWLPPDNVVQVAEAELAREDARSALRALAGETGPEAERLRAAALAQLGDASAAARAFTAAGDAASARTALWRAEDWAAGAPTLPEGREAALAVLAEPGRPADAASAPLAAGQALIGESETTRQAIAKLLSAIPPPPAEAE